MQKRKRNDRDYVPAVDLHEPVQLDHFEMTLEECDGDYGKLVKKFMRKVRKHEILKPFYGRLMFYTTKGQKRRQKKLNSIYEYKKNQLKENPMDIETEKLSRQVGDKKEE